MRRKKLTGSDLRKDGRVWKLWGIPLFGSEKREVLKTVEEWLEAGEKGRWLATVNPEFVMEAIRDSQFGRILKEKTDMNVMDGVGLIWAKAVGEKLPTKSLNFAVVKRLWLGLVEGLRVIGGRYEGRVVAGSDLMADFCCLAKKKHYRVFFLGGWGDRAQRTAEYFESKYPGLKTAYCRGEPDIENRVVIMKVNKFRPEILLVAYGMKKQEKWIAKNLAKLKSGVVMGVGRSFDYWSGDLKRAPKIWRKMGLEWFYSLLRQPARWRRQLALPRFVWKVIWGI